MDDLYTRYSRSDLLEYPIKTGAITRILDLIRVAAYEDHRSVTVGFASDKHLRIVTELRKHLAEHIKIICLPDAIQIDWQ